LIIQVLVILDLRNDAVDDIRDGKVAANAFDIINSIRPEQSLQNARDEINHDDTALLPKHHCELAKDLHSLLVHNQF
jgi:hypothetical protein